ncbi:MAG TPA: hypothetical protein DET40_10675 [Lentisphaeria bacterium]|nr:MAG: hypothetical protein A2X45_09605 [Lentisphaerae bacterium GWF2_50_93]HCE44002.1 hypothetical protein [Lentisphaeria bacterium]
MHGLAIDGMDTAKTKTMKIAISHSQGRIAPVFDVSGNILLIDVGEGKDVARENISIAAKGVFERARELSVHDIDLLICGAISGVQETAIRKEGIAVAGFVCGAIEDVFRAFMDGHIADIRFLMPGCSRNLQRCRNGKGGRRRGWGANPEGR